MQNLSKVNYRGSNIGNKKILAGKQNKRPTEFYHKKTMLLDKTPIYFSLGTKQQETMTRQMSRLRIPQSPPTYRKMEQSKSIQ